MFIWGVTAVPSQADTGTLRAVFGKAGVIAAVGHGEGVLVFHGRHYGFTIVGASIGATLALSATVLRGKALNISIPSDLAGTYIGSGVGAAAVAGASVVKLQNEKGVVLDLAGAKLGAEASVNVPIVTVTMK